jgi:hypothetical protein
MNLLELLERRRIEEMEKAVVESLKAELGEETLAQLIKAGTLDDQRFKEIFEAVD